MRRIKIMGLCLVALCAISVAVVSSASAAPAYYTKGKPVKGVYGASHVIAKAYTTTNTSVKSPVLLGGVKIKCTSDTGKGKISPPNKTEKTKLTYVGCKGGIGTENVACQKSASKKEVISTENLKGVLVEATKVEGEAKKTIANELQGEKSEVQAKFSCGTLKVEVKGHILAEPTPIGVEAPTGFSTNNSKPEIGTCSEQDLLYVNGVGPCVHLFTASGSSANEAKDEVKYKLGAGEMGIEIK